MGPGESHAGITVPEGDPGALRDLSRSFGAMASGLGAAAESFGALPGELSGWRGQASVAFAATASESNAAARNAAVAFARKQRAVEVLSEELEVAQDDAREAIEQAREAERRIEAAGEEVEAAREARTEALERAAAADMAAAMTDVVGAASLQALADRQAALDEAEAAAERQQAAQRRLERAEDDLEQAQRRGARIGERAEELSADASRAIAAVAPTVALASLGGPAVGIGGGMSALSPLAALGAVHGMRPLLPLGNLRRGTARAFREHEVERSPLADLLRAAGFATGLVGLAPKVEAARTEILEKRLHKSVDPVTRADLARGLLDDVSEVSDSGPGRVARKIPLLAPLFDLAANRAEDRGWLSSLGNAASKAAGGLLGGTAGGAGCVQLAVVTGGTGAVSCPTLITLGGAAGSEGAGKAYDAVEGAVVGERPEPARHEPALVPLVPLELLRDDIPPLRAPGALLIEDADSLRPLDRFGNRP